MQIAEDFLTASKLTGSEKGEYTKVKKIVSDFFIVKCNIIYEQAKFNTKIQLERESIESFAIDSRKLGEHCQQADFVDEFIRERIFIVICDQLETCNLMQI